MEEAIRACGACLLLDRLDVIATHGENLRMIRGDDPNQFEGIRPFDIIIKENDGIGVPLFCGFLELRDPPCRLRNSR